MVIIKDLSQRPTDPLDNITETAETKYYFNLF